MPNFNELPIEVLLKLYSYLGLSKITEIKSVNKQFYQIASHQELWKTKLQQHFPHVFSQHQKHPHLFSEYRQNEIMNWYDLFRSVYQAEYEKLSARMKKLFSLVKEGNISDLSNSDFQLNDLETLDGNKRSLISWTNQSMLDYFYQLAEADPKAKITMLHWAVKCNQPGDKINSLIQQGFVVNGIDHSYATPLYLAAEMDHVNAVNVLLENNAEVNVFVSNKTPLYVAAENGQLDIVEALLKNGADVDLGCHGPRYTDNASPLFIAASHGHVDIVKSLLEYNADMDFVSKMNGMTPLLAAGINEHTDVIITFLEKKPDIIPLIIQDEIHTAKNFPSSQESRALKNIVQVINKQNLRKYLAKATQRADDSYKKSLNVLGLFSINFGYSGKQKKEASSALAEVVFNGKDPSCLDAHKEVLENGELGNIYRSIDLPKR